MCVWLLDFPVSDCLSPSLLSLPSLPRIIYFRADKESWLCECYSQADE